MKSQRFKGKKPTHWQGVQKWYDGLVGGKGHYYHQSVIIPGILRLLEIDKATTGSLLDIACGQGVLSRCLPKTMKYTGLDASKSLIDSAQKRDAKTANCKYIVADATKPFPIKENDFSFATIVLALQNIENPQAVFENCTKHLKDGARLAIVLNHPCFRIPRQSSWQIDESNKMQYRRVNRYMSPIMIPIQAHPSQGNESVSTESFHFPLSSYIQFLSAAGFVVENCEEWCSDKVSTGRAAKMENRSRAEIPLFLCLIARKASK
jgi:ubiquinone/menaquinone biosynthesis C-methylase UbiE